MRSVCRGVRKTKTTVVLQWRRWKTVIECLGQDAERKRADDGANRRRKRARSVGPESNRVTAATDKNIRTVQLNQQDPTDALKCTITFINFMLPAKRSCSVALQVDVQSDPPSMPIFHIFF